MGPAQRRPTLAVIESGLVGRRSLGELVPPYRYLGYINLQNALIVSRHWIERQYVTNLPGPILRQERLNCFAAPQSDLRASIGSITAARVAG